MKVNSLLLKSNMIFARNESEITERESYLIVKTLSNPNFFWGNYLIFKKPPVEGEIINWMNIFQKEMTHYKEIEHYVFAWDEDSAPKSMDYLSHNFDLEEAVILKTNTLIPPKHFNKDIVVRELTSDKDWEEATELQVMTREEEFTYEHYKTFKLAQNESYKKLISKKRGARFGAFLNNVLVADLGIYFEDGLGRYQNVVTHPEFRRQGICATLVYESGKFALENWPVSQLVMVADPGYHAARIYESVGFLPVEHAYSLYWNKFKN